MTFHSKLNEGTTYSSIHYTYNTYNVEIITVDHKTYDYLIRLIHNVQQWQVPVAFVAFQFECIHYYLCRTYISNRISFVLWITIQTVSEPFRMFDGQSWLVNNNN